LCGVHHRAARLSEHHRHVVQQIEHRRRNAVNFPSVMHPQNAVHFQNAMLRQSAVRFQNEMHHRNGVHRHPATCLVCVGGRLA
jgi:hypothetical protein